jgi:hypothetical protein
MKLSLGADLLGLLGINRVCSRARGKSKRTGNPDRSPLPESRADTQPQLHPALLRLSAMIFQQFI